MKIFEMKTPDDFYLPSKNLFCKKNIFFPIMYIFHLGRLRPKIFFRDKSLFIFANNEKSQIMKNRVRETRLTIYNCLSGVSKMLQAGENL